MQTEKRSEHTPSPENGKSAGDQQQGIPPARLPFSSRAAAAQRLNDTTERGGQGISYEGSSQGAARPAGWRIKRHLKRKNLRQSNMRYAAIDRIGTHTMLPIAFILFSLFLIAVLVLVTMTGFINATQQRFGQDVTKLEDILPKDNLKMYDASGTEIYQMLDQGMQTSVPLSQVSPHLADAEIAIEDQYFWKNPGYDITGIVRAAIDNLSRNHVVSGGSTITQQLIKNAIVGNQSTILRKLQELILAPQITRYYTKEQILNMYLNTTYYGEQAYGAEAAAFTYFNLKATNKMSAASQLDIAQSAMLAGIPSSPIARDPYLHPKAAQTRMQEVLQEMFLQGYITADDKAAAIAEAQKPNFLHHSTINNRLAPHFAHYALEEAANDLHVPAEDLSRTGLIITTTLNLKLQDQVLKIAQKHIAEMARAHHMSNAAVVVIDYRTGAIRTLLGNIDPNNPQYGDFDVASQGFRQPGSSFKPFIYETAFQQHISPGMPVMDGPLTVQMCCGLPSYSPNNYDLRYHGLISYRYALQNSFNIPAVRLLLRTGVEPALHTAQIMGIGDRYLGTPNYTMVLGTLSVHLLDETSAYGVFAYEGLKVEKHSIDTIYDTGHHVIYRYQPKPVRIISKQTAYIMTDVLSDNSSRTYEFGKCSSLFLYSNTMTQCYSGNPGSIRPSAAKTGTSTDFKDNWTVGYTSDFVVGVWAGNNDSSPMVNVSGVDGAAPIWHDTLLLAEKGRPIKNLQPARPPAGLVKKTVKYPGITTTDWYLK